MTQKQPSVLVYIGTYTHKGSAGVYIYRLDTTSGALDIAAPPAAITNPSFLAIAPQKQNLYAVAELGEFQEQPGGGVSAFAIAAGSGALTLLNQRRTHGAAPCHLCVDATGRYVLVANYSSGTVSMLPVQADGSLGEATEVIQHKGSGPDPRRQRGPHAHSVTLDPTNRFAFVCDLGIDKVMVYRLDLANGKLMPHTPAWAEANPGAGPRHFAFHPGHPYAYVINELDSTIIAFAYDKAAGALAPLQTISTLPDDFSGANTCADVHVSPCGRFLYGSNRGHDSIAIFSIDQSSGALTAIGHASTGGKTPRNFAIDPTGAFLLAANQDSDNVVVLCIDGETGQLAPTGYEIAVSMPVCVKMIALP
ncbi:MAG: lactonase family protein [Anaerolineae bacterium]|nr:lactonase family protein [Anaerolineae bacterium]